MNDITALTGFFSLLLQTYTENELISAMTNTPDTKPNTIMTCTMFIKSGARKGEKCGKKVSPQSTTGHYCTIHLKNEREEQAFVDSTLLFMKNEHGNFIYGKTGLVLKSAEDKRIIGKQIGGEIVDLTDEDIILCQKKRFRYIENYSRSQNELS